MNRKGEVGVGSLITIAIVAIVGVILLTASAQQVGDATNTRTVANATFAGTNATNTSIDGKSWSGLIVYNATNDEIIGSGNYTLYNNVVVDGGETARLEKHTNHLRFNGNWLISGTSEPTTYINSGGGRTIAGLIIIFFGLAIALIMLIPTLRDGVLSKI